MDLCIVGLFQSIIVCHVSLIFTQPSVYAILVDMIYTFNLGALRYITFFVVCMQLEYKVAKRSGYIINRIYTLDTSDEHRLEQVVRLTTMKLN